MHHHLQSDCKFCETRISHQYEDHFSNTLDAVEECKFYNKAIKHYKEEHCGKIPIGLFDKVSVYSKKVIRGILKDILGILLLPFSLFVSVMFKAFEWLNDRIGLFD